MDTPASVRPARWVAFTLARAHMEFSSSPMRRWAEPLRQDKAVQQIRELTLTRNNPRGGRGVKVQDTAQAHTSADSSCYPYRLK
ncbi:unnamed protein product [Lota lota]